ncbi:MAG: hypothetical protein AABY42_03400 [Nitrospirota bacterium]
MVVIRSFGCRETAKLSKGIKYRKLPHDIQACIVVRLAQIDAAVTIDDRWRICFRFDADGAHDMKIVDYH